MNDVRGAEQPDRKDLLRLVDMPALVDFILASDWLARVKRKASATALERVASEVEEVDRIEHKPYRETTAEERAVYTRYHEDHQGVGKLAQAAWLRSRASELRASPDAD